MLSYHSFAMSSIKALTYTCYQMYARMETGISAEYVQFTPGEDFRIGAGAPHYLLRPETVESFFILNQLTGDPVYR
jgi:Glycosyl hydrolase family 47